MKKHIRIVSLLLVLVMLVGMLPLSLLAADDVTKSGGDTGGALPSLIRLRASAVSLPRPHSISFSQGE